jgi:hypothetical protein
MGVGLRPRRRRKRLTHRRPGLKLRPFKVPVQVFVILFAAVSPHRDPATCELRRQLNPPCILWVIEPSTQVPETKVAMTLRRSIFAGSLTSMRQALRALGICLLGAASSLLVHETARLRPVPAAQPAYRADILAASIPTLRCDRSTFDCLRPEPSSLISSAGAKWKRRVFVEGTAPVSTETLEAAWLEPPTGQGLTRAIALRTGHPNPVPVSNRQRAP